MPNYSASGTENLRANPEIYHVTSSESPNASGTDAGGTANLGGKTQTFDSGHGPANNSSTPPSPPQSFSDAEV